MVNRLLQPQEVEVHYVLPAIRRELALALKAQGLEQREIAHRLFVTEPAVSQYVNNKRGTDISFTPHATEAIRAAAGRIFDHQSLMREVQALLKVMTEERITCRLHAKLAGLPQECNVCFERPVAHPNVVMKR